MKKELAKLITKEKRCQFLIDKVQLVHEGKIIKRIDKGVKVSIPHRQGTTGGDNMNNKIITMCQFLIGKVQQEETI